MFMYVHIYICFYVFHIYIYVYVYRYIVQLILEGQSLARTNKLIFLLGFFFLLSFFLPIKPRGIYIRWLVRASAIKVPRSILCCLHDDDDDGMFAKKKKLRFARRAGWGVVGSECESFSRPNVQRPFHCGLIRRRRYCAV